MKPEKAGGKRMVRRREEKEGELASVLQKAKRAMCLARCLKEGKILVEEASEMMALS